MTPFVRPRSALGDAIAIVSRAVPIARRSRATSSGAETLCAAARASALHVDTIPGGADTSPIRALHVPIRSITFHARPGTFCGRAIHDGERRTSLRVRRRTFLNVGDTNRGFGNNGNFAIAGKSYG